ncbi:MAG TPA: PilZ domain-containing protein [Nitrospiraceae bacterium]|nr:PilZ domain-containing protein [Nitrospiraceae bacterium]
MTKPESLQQSEREAFQACVPLEQRRAQRVADPCYFTYSGVSGERVVVGEGSIIDLSTEGFGVDGNREVQPGALLTLCLCLPDGEMPILIEEVRVAWVSGKRFGVQSLAIGHEERKRLTGYVWKFLAHDARKQPRNPSEPQIAEAV